MLGDIAGAPGKLPYSKEVHDYMRLLEKSSPRVKVYSIGKSEEGREMLAVAVASEALMAQLEANKADLAKLADPRTIKMDDALADEIAKRAAPVYYITGTIHSTEAGAPTALMELAYRLAVDDSPYIRNIREHVITLITPVVEVDGRDRVVDLYNYRKANPGQDRAGRALLGQVRRARQQPRRDGGDAEADRARAQHLRRLRKRMVLHDLHESGSFLYDNTIGDGPYNAWLDPILTNEWQMIGWNNVNEMTRLGMPGVYAFGTFDTWSPGYLMFIAATHNGISRLYETFGNGGSADTRRSHALARRDVADLVPAESAAAVREVVAPQQQQLRADRPDRLAQPHREQPAVLPAQLLREEQAVDSQGEDGGPGGLRAAGDRDAPGRAGRAAARAAEAARRDLARDRGVHRAGPRARRRRRGAGGAAAARAAAGAGGRRWRGRQRGGGPRRRRRRRAHRATETREFPAGSYIVRMDQPYSRIADALLDYQVPGRRTIRRATRTTTRAGRSRKASPCRPFACSIPRCSTRRSSCVKSAVRPPSGVAGQGSDLRHQPQRRQRADHAALQAASRRTSRLAEEPFEAAGQKFARGSFIVRDVSQADLDAADEGSRPAGVRARRRRRP